MQPRARAFPCPSSSSRQHPRRPRVPCPSPPPVRLCSCLSMDASLPPRLAKNQQRSTPDASTCLTPRSSLSPPSSSEHHRTSSSTAPLPFSSVSFPSFPSLRSLSHFVFCTGNRAAAGAVPPRRRRAPPAAPPIGVGAPQPWRPPSTPDLELPLMSLSIT